MFVRANDLLKQPHSKKWTKFTFGCSSLDACTNGGIITRGITEIYGEAGSGKSHILIQLCLTVQLPEKYGGLNKKAAIICTEGKFPSKRCTEIANYLSNKYQINKDELLNGVFVQYIIYADKLIECLSNELIELLETKTIGLIAIDSIASLFRSEPISKDRTDKFKLLGDKLLNIIEKYNCAVVCSNQVSSYDNLIVPCLGLTWSHQVRNRFRVERTEQENESSDLKLIRKFEVIYSPEIPFKNCCTFLITNDGVLNF